MQINIGVPALLILLINSIKFGYIYKNQIYFDFGHCKKGLLLKYLIKYLYKLKYQF